MRTGTRGSNVASAIPWLAVAAAALLGFSSWRLGRPGAAPTAPSPTLEERVWRAERGLPAPSQPAHEPDPGQSSGR